MATAEPTALIEFLTPYPPHVQELALKARAFLAERFNPVSEIFWDATSAVCSGFTFTHRTQDNFFNLAVYSNHVTLIFPYGVQLNDPEGRLRGEGTRIRNIRLKDYDSLIDPYVTGLIDQCATMATRPVEALEPTVIVRVSNGPKRRPRQD